MVSHWGNLRAKLEMSIEAVLNLASRERPMHGALDNYDSESEDGGILSNDPPLTTVQCGHLVNLRDLLQHGLRTGPHHFTLPLLSSSNYVVNTGFQDALQSLDRLTPHKFDLPVDLAIKQFQNIKDVFM
ncbi:hypothetical protein EVAR_98277_1 [Eumeta japonica]|uniref:Uncharacterized protein n=1 Tax=Eumeta variegata TaxID=151549 RepID=A0A4C2A3G6_EUMVA|nr:hypothetical protein EVAR_98277_1 [Eumeta japonica]